MREYFQSMAENIPTIENKFGDRELLPFENYIFASLLLNLREIIELKKRNRGN